VETQTRGMPHRKDGIMYFMERIDRFVHLRDAIATHPIGPFLLTVTGEARPHVGDVRATWRGEEIVVAAPSSWPGSARYGHTDVSLLWPPSEPGGYSLIVDGTASTAGGELTITPTRAVHYRPHRGQGESGEECGNDCVPIFPAISVIDPA
jgi:hypothetical protein